MSMIFSNLVVSKTLSSNHRMYNLYTKFVKILEICKQFYENLVNESGNVPCRDFVSKYPFYQIDKLANRGLQAVVKFTFNGLMTVWVLRWK